MDPDAIFHSKVPCYRLSWAIYILFLNNPFLELNKKLGPEKNIFKPGSVVELTSYNAPSYCVPHAL